MSTPVRWRQLRAIATSVLMADPSVDWFEWAERIKCRLAQLRIGYPDPPQQLTAAMEAAASAYEKRWGQRPSSVPPPSRARRETPNLDPPLPIPRRGGGFTSLQTLLTSFLQFDKCGPLSERPSGERSRPMGKALGVEDPVTPATPKCLGCGTVERRIRDENGRTIDVNLFQGLCLNCLITAAHEARGQQTMFHSRLAARKGEAVDTRSLFDSRAVAARNEE
jgi:hypothetical protein